jgi:hypothetical protein
VKGTPIGFGAGDPNLYRDEGDSPLNSTDSSGLKPKSHWIDLAKKQLSTTTPTTRADYLANNKKITAAYAQMYLNNRRLYAWAGLAVYVSYKVGEGMNLAAWARVWGQAVMAEKPDQLIEILTMGNHAIYLDIYWQFLAYDTGGWKEIVENWNDIPLDMRAVWTRIELGRQAEALPVLGASTVGLMGSPLGAGPFPAVSALFPGKPQAETGKAGSNAFQAASKLIARYEQEKVLQKIFDKDKPFATKLTLFTTEGPLPKTGFGPFGGNFGDLESRWKWIRDELFPTWDLYQSEHTEEVTKFMEKRVQEGK